VAKLYLSYLKKNEVHPNMIARWKRQFLEAAPQIFLDKRYLFKNFNINSFHTTLNNKAITQGLATT
jgi:hypothetical protein